MAIDKYDIEALITPDELEGIIQGATKNSVAMQIFTRLPNMSSKQMKLRVLDALPSTYWVDNSTNNGRKNITKMAWDKKFITAEELAVIVPIKQELLDDADIDIWGQVRPRVEEAFGKKFDQAVFSGVDKPAGFRADLLTSIVDAGHLYTPSQDETLYHQISEAMGLVEEDDYNPDALVGGLSLKKAFRGMVDTTGQPLASNDIDGLTKYFVSNGAWDKTLATMIVGDFKQAVYSVRQDVSVKLLEESIIQDGSGNIIYNLAQEDMVALRFVFRIGWEIPNPINAENPNEKTRFPFSAIKGSTGVTTQTVTFTVTDGSASAIEGAKVKLGGMVGKTNASGVATFSAQAGKYDYTVKADGYAPTKGTLTVASSSVSESITLNF